MAERPLYTLYKGLKANNYDVPSSYDSFEKTLVEAGNGGANARHTLFNSLKSQGYDVPDTYESFYRTLFTPINKTTSRAIGGDVPMSEADKRRFSAGAANISAQARQTMQNAGRYNKLKNRQKKQKNDFGRVSIGTHQTPYGGDADNVVKDDFAYNPETGKAGTYVNSDSDDAYNLAEAEQKQAALDQQNQAYQEAVNAGDIPSVFDVRDKTGNYDLQENVGKDGTYVTEEGMQVQYEKKLADAYARKKELEGMIAADNEKNGNPLLSYSASVGAGSGASQDRRMMDVALNQVNAEINSLEAITQTDKNAWYQDMQKAMENTAFTAKTWDFGISDFALMGQLERIKAKMDQKIPLNGMEQTLLKSKVGADAAAALEDEKMGAVYRWTKIAGQSLPFMADFFLTGGYGGITKATSNAALKFAAKKGMGKLGAAILKNTGVVGADIIGSYAMAGTEQAFKTGADIMQRHMGNLYQDENSNYKFGTFDENGNLLHEGGESMGKALYKGMTAAMLENYTEKIFGHNYGLKKGALRFMENHGMARSAEIFKNIGQKEWYAGSKKWMEKFGINGFAEEVMEEEINIPLNALLVGDNKASDLLDPKQQMDIIGGMALSVGSMYALGAGTRPLKGVYNRAQYYRYKNKVDSSDTDAYTAFGSNDAEKWESLRDKIDNAPNEKMGGVLASIITSRDELTKDQIDAAVHYGINLMKMRGYNLAKTEEMNAKEMTGETATPKEQHDEEVETAYSEGHDAEDADKHNIQMEAEDQMTTLAGMLGITEQQLSGMTDEELESLTGQDDKLDQAIYDYQLSTARYQGVVDNANDKVEAAARQASHQTDMLTDKSRGTVRNATVIGINGEEDYGVYIISGKLATHEDGAINIGDSDSMIIYYDPKTQSVEHADARRFVALGDEVPAEEVKAQAIADAKEAAIKAEAGIIDGTVEAGTQFSTTDADGSEHTYEVLADNGDGTAMITIDGNVEQNPYTFEELQTLKDAEDLKRLNAAKAQRGMKEEQRAQQQKEDEQKNAILEQITNADGNVVLVDVIDADGNTRYPGSQVFLVSNDGAKAKVMEMDAEGNLKPHAVNKEDITEISTMSQDEFKQTLPASNIEEDRGEIEVEETEPEPIGKGVFGNVYDQFKGKVKAAFDFLLKHKGGDLLGVFHRDDVGDIDLVWGDKTKNQGIDHIIDKHIEQHNDFASVDEAMSVIDDVINNGAINEKKSKWDKVVIEKDGYSVVIRKNLRDDKGNVVDNSKNWVVTAFESEHKQGEKKVSSDATLAAPSINEGSRAVAPDETSDGKGTNNSAENNENNETLTLEDGTVVPMLEDGNPDFSQLTAEQTAELYDSQFGEDAEQIISGFVSEAKKALDKATNMSVNGKNFAEQKASKADKDKAVADAQTAYDSAKAISDAYAERQLSKETDTHEGRMNLIQKAKNKYARLKNKEEWKNNPFALWNETVGKVLHRLYDGASVDVFDHEPQTVEEYVSSNIAPYSLNFEGKENSKGVAAETGLQRKDFAKSRVLAAEGKGKTVDEFVHKLWEDRPKQLENVSDQEIRNALLSLITSDMNAYDMSHVIEDNRIAQAEEELENNKRAAENAAFEEEQRKAAEEETKKQEEEAKKQAEVAAKPEEEAKAAATAEETGKLDEEMADANDEYEHLSPSYNFENDENLSEEERENMVLRDGDTFAEYRNRNGVDANGTTTPLGIKVARAYIQQKYGDKLADIDAIFGMPMKDHYDGWLMAEQMMKIVDADMNDFDAALLMKNDNVPLSSEAILGYMDGAAELIKARQDAEKLGLAAFDSAGNPVYKSIIELANWAKEQGLEVDGESVASNYANLYLACKDGFGATTLVPDKGELINMVFYFPGQLIGENGEVNQERLRQMADEFNEGRDALHSAEADIELTDGAQFYNGDTAREFRDFVDKKTEEENKPFGEQIDESELPFSVKEGKGKKQYDRAADVEKNHVSGIEVVDAVVGRKTRKAFDRLAKMMGAKIQWQYSDKMGNGWYDEKVNEDGSVERTIYLTLDSSIMEGAQFIFGHEMTHEMKSKNPTAFDELKNLIINTYGKEAFDKAVDETEKRYKDAGVNYAGGRAAYEEEVVADGIGEMIRDLNLAHTLALKMSHPLLAYLHEILQKIKRAFYGTEYSDKMKEVIRGIEQAYVKTAKGNFEAESGEAREEVDYSLREKEEPKKKGIGYKVFLLGKDGKLYPPMVANPNGAATPVGVWLDADAAPIAGESKTGRPQVKKGGKGTQGGSGKLAYRPGWHLGVIPYALQFNRKDAEGNKTLFPKNFVFAEVEYAADVDYQQEAHDAGINPSGKYQHSLAGLKHLPTDGYYMYRTNPNPETDPWVITGAMKVNRILTRAEQAELVKNAGREPQQIQEGDIVTDDVVNSINQEIADAPKFSLKVYHGSGADFTEFDFDHMGEGAGSQTFGWGGYVTSSKKIGKSYANIVDANAPHQDVEYVGNNAHEYTDVVAGLFNGGQRDYDDVQEFLQNGYNSDKDNARKKQMLEWFESTKPSDWKSVNDGKRNLYEVDIPDDNGNNYLDFENPMNEEQINTIRDALVKNGIDVSSWEKRGFKLDLPFKDVYAAVLPMMMRCEPKEVSKFLSSLGYTGIKYPAGTIMGGAEEGDTNYVIFKPEDMQITKHTKFSLKNAKPVRFEVGKSLSEDEKKEVLATLKDAYKENNVSFHTEESANGKERRVYEPTAEDYVKSDITGRALRYYITLPDGRIAHPTEVYPNISNNEVETSLKKRDVLGDEVKELIDSNVNKLRDSVTDKDKVVAILKQLQDLQHETTDVGYGLDNPQSYNYKTGVFTSNANQAIDYVVRRMRRKEEVPADVVDAVKTAVKDSFGMVDNLIDGITADAAPKTFEEFLESPSLKFQIRNEEQRKAAESAYNWAVENRPDNWKRYALVNMERPNQMPEYYEKKKLADEWRRFYNKDVHDDWGASLRKPWGNYKLFDLNKPFEENVVNVKGKVPEEFDPHKFEKNRAEIGAINKQKKELEAKLNALEEVRRTRNNDILKQYMDEHQLSSENEVPDEVDDAIKTAIDDMPSGWKMANKKMIHIAQALGENRKAEIAGEEPKFSLKDGTLIKAGTYFSGGGLVEEGLKGIIDPVVAVEYDEKISGVYRNNFGQHIVTADVRDVDPRELVKQIDGEVEYFHASPVCKNYSQAKSNHAEVELDKETAASTAEFINAVKPKVVTIENVKGYKDSDAMKTITDALDANGYTWDADVYNAADFGGYTNRERLIVRAVRDGQLPAKPKKMERKSGWYEAVADIIPTLTEKKNGVANWMDVRLKADGIDWRNIDKPLYVMGSAYADGKIPHAFADELLPTLRTKSGDVIVMPDGKVYRAMGRVLARVSGVSDDYKMPFSESLSHTIIGNGIPTQLTEQVIAPLVQNTLRPTPEDGNTKFSLRYDQFEHDLNQWKKDNGLKKDAQRPAIPTRDPGESAVDFMKKVNEYRRQMALWKTAPTYEGHLLTDGTALGEFNRELQRGSVLKRIAFQDSMLAIRKAQEAIMKEHGLDKISMAEDAYTAENRSHGKGKNELEEYNDEFLQPLRKAYKKMKDLMDGSYDNVKVYMMAKHGLERNAQIAFKKALEDDFENVNERVAAYNGYKADVARMQNDADLNNGKIDYVTWRQIDNGIRTKYAPSYPEYRYDKDGNIMDYSGLTALFEGTPDIEVAASDLVQNAEDKYDKEAADLWNAVNAATKKILRDNYKAGMMSEKVYEYVRDMYKNYIPLRGWNETQADQVWDYIGGGKGSFNQTLKEANGRTSIADDPIAYIENMAESGILINNKNWVKQHLMLLAENHPTSLLTLSKAWYVKSTDASGNETWIPASPQITSGMTNQQVEAAMEAFQKKMEKLEETGDATQQRGHMEITYPQTSSEEREHEVRVMKDGEEYVIYVNGDPQLAQAMNNTRAHRVREVQSGKLDRACAWLGRKMAAAYTSLSPLFIPSNYFRDLTMTLASTAIREDGRYNYLLRKNMATSWNMWGLLKGYKDGSLREKVRNGKATEKEQMFYDFMMNGGETGFVSSFDVEDLKKKFKGELKDMDRWAANPKKVLHTIYDSIEFMNRSIENSNRFAIYMTSIQYGRSIEEAVNNAKDVTLNFNRKGTGENGWQMIRNLYLFINPAVQSLQTLGALAKHHPYKFTAVTSAWMVSGALVPLINEGLMLCANLLAGAFGGGDDDDEYKDIKEKYWQFTKWDRRNNLIMWVPFTKEFVKIPLAQEFRGFYAVGDMIASKMLGGDTANESWGEYAEDLIGQVVDMLPLDPTGYDGNIAVSLMPNAVRPMFELAFNVDFTGKPLFKDSEYNKYAPNFTKAYAGTPDWLVRVSRMVNSIGNDYPDVQQNSIDAFGDPRYNLNNPAVVDHVLSSYLGGAYTMGSQVMGVLTKALNDPKEIKMADIPLVSKFVSNPEDRPVAKKQGDEFWTMKENHDRVANTLSKLKKQAKVDGDYSLLEQLYGSEEYKQYKLDDAKVKKYEEDKKKEKAEETGEEYKPHQRTADDVYKEHSSAKDELEDLKMKQIYAKLNGFKSSYDLLLKLAPKQSDDYYQKHKVAIDAVNAVELDKKDISDLKKDFLKDGVVNYDAEKMQKIRGLRKNVLDVLEKANKEVIAEQQKNAQK